MAYQTINPANGETLATFNEISDADLQKVLTVANTTYETDWSQRSIPERKRVVAAAAAEHVASAPATGGEGER